MGRHVPLAAAFLRCLGGPGTLCLIGSGNELVQGPAPAMRESYLGNCFTPVSCSKH